MELGTGKRLKWLPHGDYGQPRVPSGGSLHASPPVLIGLSSTNDWGDRIEGPGLHIHVLLECFALITGGGEIA